MKRRPSKAVNPAISALGVVCLVFACTRAAPREDAANARSSSSSAAAPVLPAPRDAGGELNPQDEGEEDLDDTALGPVDRSRVCNTLAPQRIDVEWSLKRVVVEWSPEGLRPLKKTDKLKLYDDTSSSVLSDCYGAGGAPPASNPNRWQCHYRETGTLSLGKIRLWTVLLFGYVSDGLGTSEHVAILLPYDGGPRILNTIDQWKFSQAGDSIRLLQRHQLSKDLDGDGRVELCIETILEGGQQLLGSDWLPITHERETHAYKFADWTLRRAKMLDKRCPETGYLPFVAPDTAGGTWRGIAQRRPLSAKAAKLAPCPFPENSPQCQIIRRNGTIGLLSVLEKQDFSSVREWLWRF